MEGGRIKKHVRKSGGRSKKMVRKSRKVVRKSNKAKRVSRRRSMRGGAKIDCSKRSWGSYLSGSKKGCEGEVDGQKVV